jgi:hypothetical protein
MKVVQVLEGTRIPLLGPIDGLLLSELAALWSFCVRQNTFPAAIDVMRLKVLFVVLLAAIQRA